MNNFLRKLYYKLPVSSRYTLRRILYFPSDLFRSKEDLVPPKGIIFTGSGDYLEVGRQYFEYFKKYGNITPDDSILDIGSGVGRMAVPFTQFLSEKGTYEGFDIVKLGVDWCTENITKRYPNFHFKLIPLKNDLYYLDTTVKAEELQFPYPDDQFDFIFLTSVFTHMLPEDVENYIREMRRVIKKDKICLATFFILDDESKNSMSVKGLKNFPHDLGHYRLMNKDVKEANVAYEKKYISDIIKKHNFEVLNFIQGNWSGIENTELNEHQDIILFKAI
ncbi:class I SAM-dependent methyltransferase [Flavobacterium amniphilum]|uniref:class I SAM-dependent methyltransferase n=1 Tax=Flavobacterium amniphilum TaxID=1834035 RepID=UPI00202ABA1B|nr:class I SAM-dependent methyltransferase [Flavobacterium amniphilum]MCL9807301.1 class I SAM-dependent methyltransferase [Flavobacterium amniphilum]